MGRARRAQGHQSARGRAAARGRLARGARRARRARRPGGDRKTRPALRSPSRARRSRLCARRREPVGPGSALAVESPSVPALRSPSREDAASIRRLAPRRCVAAAADAAVVAAAAGNRVFVFAVSAGPTLSRIGEGACDGAATALSLSGDGTRLAVVTPSGAAVYAAAAPGGAKAFDAPGASAARYRDDAPGGASIETTPPEGAGGYRLAGWVASTRSLERPGRRAEGDVASRTAGSRLGGLWRRAGRDPGQTRAVPHAGAAHAAFRGGKVAVAGPGAVVRVIAPAGRGGGALGDRLAEAARFDGAAAGPDAFGDAEPRNAKYPAAERKILVLTFALYFKRTNPTLQT